MISHSALFHYYNSKVTGHRATQQMVLVAQEKQVNGASYSALYLSSSLPLFLSPAASFSYVCSHVWRLSKSFCRSFFQSIGLTVCLSICLSNMCIVVDNIVVFLHFSFAVLVFRFIFCFLFFYWLLFLSVPVLGSVVCVTFIKHFLDSPPEWVSALRSTNTTRRTIYLAFLCNIQQYYTVQQLTEQLSSARAVIDACWQLNTAE